MRHRRPFATAVIVGAGLIVAACSQGSASSKASPVPAAAGTPSAAAPTQTVSSASSSAIAADTAICQTFNTDTKDDDLQDLDQQLLLAGTSVSYKLRHDIAEYILGATSTASPAAQLQADEQNEIYVITDCAVVKVGRTP